MNARSGHSLTEARSPATGVGCCCARWRSGWPLSMGSRPASPTIAMRNESSTSWKNWWRSGVYGLALGYEDLNDHEQLRNDPLTGGAGGEVRSQSGSAGGKEHFESPGTDSATASAQERCKKIVLDHEAVDRLLVDVFLRAHGEAPEQIIRTWMPPTIPCTENRKDGSFTATTAITAICRCTFFVEIFYWVRACGRPTSMERRGSVAELAAGSCHRFAAPGRRCALSYGEIQDSAGRN